MTSSTNDNSKANSLAKTTGVTDILNNYGGLENYNRPATDSLQAYQEDFVSRSNRCSVTVLYYYNQYVHATVTINNVIIIINANTNTSQIP